MVNLPRPKPRPLLPTHHDQIRLQTFLRALKPEWEIWDNMPKAHHFGTSPSGYYTCPHNVSGYFEKWAADRGTKFHDHFGPYILNFFFGANTNGTRFEIEERYRVWIPCHLCEDGGFWFGGSIDLFVNGVGWLIDLKFSGSRWFSAESYDPQVSAYAGLREFGEHEYAHEWVKNKWYDGKWAEGDHSPVNYVNLLKMTVGDAKNFDFLLPTERMVDPLPWKWVLQTAKQHHDAKYHKIPCYRTGPWCRWCKHQTCEHTGKNYPYYWKVKSNGTHQQTRLPSLY